MVTLPSLRKGSFVHEPAGVKTRQGMVHKPSKATAGESRSLLMPKDRSLSTFVVPLLLEPLVRVDVRAGLPGRELRDSLRPQGVEGGLHCGQALPAPGCAAAPGRGRRPGGEPRRLPGAQARRASRPQGHVDRSAAFARICHCHRCPSVSWRKMCITMSAPAWECRWRRSSARYPMKWGKASSHSGSVGTMTMNKAVVYEP
jgi:hypothetical protein